MSKLERNRVLSVDVLRGMVMILMALDHTRDYFTRLRFQPEDMARSFPALFFTRWITHFCAPIFFLLAGVGASLALSNGRTKRELSRFLLTRGLWLVVLEFTLLHVGWNFRIGFPVFLLVIWALGWSMVLLSALIFLPRKGIAAIALLLIFGHNLTDGITPASLGSFAPFWNFLHAPGFIVPGKVLIGYPLIPWAAVMALGFALGDVFNWEPSARRQLLVGAGIGAVVLFVALRFFNAYGNPAPWSSQSSAAMTVASFLNLLKYPPSLQYLLMTLGPALIVLALLERARGAVAEIIAVYGRVPMFFFIVHVFLIHTLAYAFASWQGGDGSFINLDTGSFPAWYGLGLPGVYAVWLLVIALLYYPCRWYSRLKSTRRHWLLSYI